jgi:flagellin-specific chaperone FliS
MCILYTHYDIVIFLYYILYFRYTIYEHKQVNHSSRSIVVCLFNTAVCSVATAIADIFRNNRISVGRNLAKILKIFEKIDEAKSRGVI